MITGATHVACGSYDNAGGDGSAVLRLNTDGVAATAVTTGVSPPQTITPAFAIGARSDGTAKFKGRVAQFTITKGSVATAAQLLAFVLAYWGEVGDGEQQVSVTRATTETCQINGANGTIYTMPNNVACVNENGLQVFAASTNLVIRGDELDNADWTVASGTPTVVAAAGASLYDTDTAGNIADSIEDNDATTAECIKAAARCGTTTGTYSASAYVKWASGSPDVTIGIQTDGTGSVFCTTTSGAGAFARVTCSNKAITGTPTSNDIWICPGRQSVVGDVGKILVFGVQCEAQANVTPVIRTAGATATRNVINVSAVTTGMLNVSDGQVAETVTFPPTWAWGPTQNSLLDVSPVEPLILYPNGTSLDFDSSTTNIYTVAALAGRAPRFTAQWSSSQRSVCEVGAGCSTPGAAPGASVAGSPYYFGSNNGNYPANAYIKDVRLCRSPGGCE